MNPLRKPDWKRPISTGLWGIGYHANSRCDVVLLSNGTTHVGEDPERLWPFLIMHDWRRDVEAERSLKDLASLQGLLQCRQVNNEDIPCIREKDVEELLKALR